uniref:Golgi to ER traffic protein 4 homolog n=1 Tax=Plectus sambesii TaxID=2011161 RepID=A0A914XFY4_9BILA
MLHVSSSRKRPLQNNIEDLREEGNVKMAKVSRLEKKLTLCLAEGDFYEAHQIYRTLYYRMADQHKYSELLELLYEGASKFIELNQPASGTDLAELYIEALQKSNTPVSSPVLNQIESLFAKIPAELASEISTSGQKVDRRTKFLNNALKWSMDVSKKKEHRTRGHPDLHQRIAGVLWHEHNYEQSRNHFLLSDDGETFASFLIDFHLQCGLRGEVDLFVTQAVLQILCRKKTKTASACFFHYAEKHPGIQGEPPYKLPLLNFIWLLLMCLEVKKVTHFSTLVEQYQPSIRRDPTYTSYLDKIGQLYFGLPPPRQESQPMGGMFANLLKGLMGDTKKEAVESDSGESSDTGDNDTICSDGYETPSSEAAAPSAASSALLNDDELD